MEDLVKREWAGGWKGGQAEGCKYGGVDPVFGAHNEGVLIGYACMQRRSDAPIGVGRWPASLETLTLVGLVRGGGSRATSRPPARTEHHASSAWLVLGTRRRYADT